MGAMVGAGIGFIGGCASAYQTRTLWVLPATMVASGVSFGSFMSLGMVIRQGGM